MKKIVFILPLFALLLLSVSCKKEKKEAAVADVELFEGEPQSVADFCLMTRQLKDQFKKELKATSGSHESLVIDFLTSYVINQIQLTGFLEEQENGNTALVCEDVFSIGDELTFGLLKNNTTFLREGVVELLEPISADFLEIYCVDMIDEPAILNGELQISSEELNRRMAAWKSLLDRNIGEEYRVIAGSQYDKLVSIQNGTF